MYKITIDLITFLFYNSGFTFFIRMLLSIYFITKKNLRNEIFNATPYKE